MAREICNRPVPSDATWNIRWKLPVLVYAVAVPAFLGDVTGVACVLRVPFLGEKLSTESGGGGCTP